MAILNRYNFSGGMNSKVSPLFIADNECEVIQNYHLDKVGALKKRNGMTQLGAQIVNTKSILGLYCFKDIQGTDYSNVFAVVNDATNTNSDIFAVESGAWAISKADDTASKIPYFTTFLDYVFRVNDTQVMASSQNPTPTGGSWSTTNCLATYVFKYICVWEDRVYVLNDNSTNKKPSRIAWSSLPVSGNPLTITWAYDGTTASGKDAADINPDDGDQITWGEPFGSRLLIFKENGLYRWTFGQVEPDKIIDVGTPQGLTVKQIHGICFFANKFGVWAYSGGSQPKLISRKVQPFIDAITTANLTNMRAEVDNDHYYLYIGTVSDVLETGDSFANAMLVYHISLNAWTIYTFPAPITAMSRFKAVFAGINDAIYAGDNDGFVYQLFNITQYLDILDSAGTAIDGLIRAKEYSLDFPKTVQLKNFVAVAQVAQGTKVGYKIDRSAEVKPWKDLKERFTEGTIVGRAKTFQPSFTNNSRVAPDIVEGFSLEFQTEGEMRREKDDISHI